MTRFVVALLVAAVGFAEAYAETPDKHDWPTYNHDVLGTRFNAAEKSLSAVNAAQLAPARQAAGTCTSTAPPVTADAEYVRSALKT